MGWTVKLKPGVRLQGIRPEMMPVMMAAERIWSKYPKKADPDGPECTITSGIEGSHSEYSDHYKGLALDFRTRYFHREDSYKVKAEMVDSLGDDYYILLHETHLHVSYRPRRLI